VLDVLTFNGCALTPDEIAGILNVKPSRVRRWLLELEKAGLVASCGYVLTADGLIAGRA
jgi:Mn-dependent DtxR family transcriptional regulator